MAIVYQCDRCGKYVDHTYEDGYSNVENCIFYISNSKMDGDQDFLDLCDDCYREFAKWWNGDGHGHSKHIAVYPFVHFGHRKESNDNETPV